MKKFLALLLAMAMVLSMAACGSTDSTTSTVAATEATTEEMTAAEAKWAEIDAMNYDDASDYLYDIYLGEFYEYYSAAKEEVTDLSLRYALMAIAEAKLMESGAFIPYAGDGGSFAMSRVVPRTVTTTSWGLDEYKWYTMLVCNELITSEDRTALIELWSEAEDEDAWMEAARTFLDENGYTLNDTYNFANSYELATWDVIATYYTSDSYFISCTYSSLLEYDSKNVQQPALAESYEVSDDGLTYTFHIREGVYWVDQQGREVAEVTANDWVASMKHLIDNNDMLGYLMTSSEGCGIKNYDAYLNGEVDFSEVGVKAIDDYTLEYTLEAPFPAFLSMLGYGCFAPLCETFYKAQGGTFSVDGDEYTAGTYGTSPETIAYCGPYLVTNYTEKNIISYEVNPSYWNLDAVNTPYVNWYYNDGSDVLRSYEEAKAGTIASCAFNSSSLIQAKEDCPDGSDETYFDLYNYTTTNSATTYCGWVNMYRQAYANFNDSSVGVSTKAEEEKVRTREALSNQNFRLAIAFAFDRGAFNAQTTGEELKYASLKNSYVTGTFVQLSEDVTVDINGTSTTFAAGTYYGEVMQAQLDADGVPITVWDPTADGGVGSGDGFDGWYDPDNALAYLEEAIAELAEMGVEVSVDNPIRIETYYGSYSELSVNRAQAYKQSIETVTGGLVVVDLVAFDDQTSLTNAYYRITSGSEANFDVAPYSSGWGPDYGDPQTFLDTLQPYGSMTKNIGLY